MEICMQEVYGNQHQRGTKGNWIEKIWISIKSQKRLHPIPWGALELWWPLRVIFKPKGQAFILSCQFSGYELLLLRSCDLKQALPCPIVVNCQYFQQLQEWVQYFPRRGLGRSPKCPLHLFSFHVLYYNSFHSLHLIFFPRMWFLGFIVIPPRWYMWNMSFEKEQWLYSSLKGGGGLERESWSERNRRNEIRVGTRLKKSELRQRQRHT